MSTATKHTKENMKIEWNDSLGRATRLVNAGDLMAATALIQQTLGVAVGGDRAGWVPTAPSGAPMGDVPTAADYLEGEFDRLSTDPIDPTVTTDPADPTITTNPADPTDPTDRTGRNDAPPTQVPPYRAGQARPGPGGEAGRFIALSYRNTAGVRAYKLYVPAGGNDVARPLIVMLHGCTQGPDDFADGTGMNALADRHGFLVAYPEQPQSANSSRCWNWFNAADQHRDRGEPSLIAGIAADVGQRFAVDADRIHIVGFSAGAAMAAVVAAAYPDVFASAAIHSGVPLDVAHDVPSALAVMRTGPVSGLSSTNRGATLGTLANSPLAGYGVGARGRPAGQSPALRTPTIVFHGDRDTIVHPRNGEHIVTQWLSSGHDPDGGDSVTTAGDPAADGTSTAITERGQAPGGRPFTRRILRGDRDRPLLEHWRVHGGTHAWSGGNAAGSHTDPKGPDASAEIVRFFAQNPRRRAPA